jgi:hypothetical protein
LCVVNKLNMQKVIFWRLLFLVCSFQCINEVNAQYYTYGQDPASQKWRQIRTENFSLIYPETMENRAQDLAHFLELIRTPLSSSLHTNPQPIPVILRNQTMLSNGFVMWAPKRIEMVTTIPYDNQATDWMKYLSVHEYRHVVQVESLNRSTTGFLTKVFGQHIIGVVSGLPLWFLEGDAVLAETAFTYTGRGRLPAFSMPLTAQVLEQGLYTYDKAYFGSYRDMVPDHYTLGYHLVAGTHARYGFEPFIQATRQVSATPFIPGSFARGVKRVTGNNLQNQYKEVMTKLEDEWGAAFSQSAVSDYEVIEPKNKLDYLNYINPQYLDDETFIAFRTTPADIPRLVRIMRDGSEETLFTPGYAYLESMSYSAGLVAWLEITRDPRWEYRNWTNIRLYGLNTGETRLIKHNGRLQAPMLSPDGLQIAAVEVDENNHWALLIFDTSTGNELNRISDPEIDFLMEPAWSDCGLAVIAIAFIEGKGKYIVKSHINNPGFEYLLHAGYTEINEPVIHDCVIYFTGTWTGRDELYAWDIDDRQLSKVLSSPFGATCASFSDDGSRILFSDFTSTGYRIAEAMDVNRIPVQIEQLTKFTPDLYAPAARETNLVADTISIPDFRFESRKFRKLPNLLHFHSWAPLSVNVDALDAKPGMTVFSQDLLGTTVLAGGYEYNSSNNGHKAFADLSVMALYPAFDLRFDAGSEDRLYRTEDDSIVKLRTSFAMLGGGAGLPLSFNNHALIYGLNLRISTSQEVYSFTWEDNQRRRGLRSMSYTFSMYAYRRMAYRDLYPKFGISAALGLSHTPFRRTKSFTDLNAGDISYGVAAVFLPGLFRHHSLRLYAGYQQRNIQQAYFSDRIRFAKGYDAQFNDRLTTFSATYSFPVLYPDLALGYFIYNKRIKAGLFADHSRAVYRGQGNSWNAYGIDILFDVHLLRLIMPFEIGFRTIYLENEKNLSFEFLWGVDFYSIGQRMNYKNMAFAPVF